jgi:hypothetical protein
MTTLAFGLPTVAAVVAAIVGAIGLGRPANDTMLAIFFQKS